LTKLDHLILANPYPSFEGMHYAPFTIQHIIQGEDQDTDVGNFQKTKESCIVDVGVGSWLMCCVRI
jgi:hypothetical protein